MGFVKVASVTEVGLGKMKGVKADGKPVLLADVGGKYYAVGNVCTHLGCMLSDGMLEGGIIQCACHGSRFDVKTGRVVGGPATKSEPVYEVKVEADQILVSV
jgi:nitrite reductase/ring-hydroxylating ferredoxin subunit